MATNQATSGKLRLHVIEAQLTRDTEFFSKMDPWCQIETRQQKVRTRHLDGAGKTPKWNQTFDLDVKYIGDDMTVTVLDQDVITSDTVGSTTIKISSLCTNGGMDDWFPIQYKGKKAGQVHLKGEWTPMNQSLAGMAFGMQNMAAQTAQQMGFAQPQQVFIQQPAMWQQPMMQQPMMYVQPGMVQQPMMQQPMMQQPMMQQPMMQQQPMYQQQPVMQQQRPVMGQPQMYGQQQPTMQHQPPQQQPQQQYYPQLAQNQQQQFPQGGYGAPR